MLERNTKRLFFTGINIGDFEGGLAPLVRAVDRVEGLERLRISSIDPDEVNDDLLEAVVTGRTTCPSMHLVLQSGSNVILKRMNRKYTRHDFFQSVEKLKKADPTFTFTTDIIVGFPGESESDFEETLEVMEEVKFAKVHMFPYSERARTRAALFPNKVAYALMQERKQKLMRRAEEQAFALREQYVGQRLEVLIEGDEKFGHTKNFLPVHVEGRALKANDLVTVETIKNSPTGLIGHAN